MVDHTALIKFDSMFGQPPEFHTLVFGNTVVNGKRVDDNFIAVNCCFLAATKLASIAEKLLRRLLLLFRR
jgi:hypothetical protein